jgi:hypothetical protein
MGRTKVIGLAGYSATAAGTPPAKITEITPNRANKTKLLFLIFPPG